MSKEEIQEILEAEAVKCNKGICESYEYCAVCKDKEVLSRETLTPCADAKIVMDDITKKLTNYKKMKADLQIRKDRVAIWKNVLNG